MDATEKLKAGDVAKAAVGPGRSVRKSASRFTHWREAGIIPPDGQVWGPGGPAFVFPQSAGAIAAVLFDLFDAGIVKQKAALASLWRYFAEPHDEGGEPLITHVLAEVAAGREAWVVLTLWRHQVTGEIAPTCATRFVDDMERAIEGPSPDHAAVADYVVKLHVLLARFATQESNVRTLGERT